MENKLYNPAGQPKDWLIENFVARTSVFKKIFKDLETGTMQYPEQNYLIQGQRGMGKTTLLLRLKYEIENTPELIKWMVPVFFNEESYDLTSLSNLWEKLLKYLDNLWQTGGMYYRETDKFVGTDDYEKRIFELLISILKSEQKKLVIFFDNFGQLFLDNLKEKEQRRLREVLMNCNDIRIVGASAIVLEDLYDYSKPFFEFFKIINLEGLNKDDTIQLIGKLQEGSEKKINIEKSKGKIETLGILTGGVIRTIMLIYEVILADEDGTALQNLEIILDRITPLYKHRIEDLPVQQRKIIDVIAKRWDAISTKEIAENIRENGKLMSTKLISAQLQQLEKNNILEKKHTNTKNHLYQLNERFFNIWYLMRNGDRMDRCRVMWLTKFLEAWYDGESIGNFIKKHIELLQSGKYYASSAIMIAEALTYSANVGFEDQATIIKATEVILNDDQKKLLPQVSLEKFNKARVLYNEEKYKEAIMLLESIDQTSGEANTLLFNSYFNLDKPAKAIEVLNDGNNLKPLLLGMAYLKLVEPQKAIKYLNASLDIDISGINIQKSQIASAIGIVYQTSIALNLKRAIKYHKLSIELGNEKGYYELANCYTKIGDFVNAEKEYLNGIEAGDTTLEKKLIDFYVFKGRQVEKALDLIEKTRFKYANDGDFLFYEGFSLFDNDNDGAEKVLFRAKDLLTKGNYGSRLLELAQIILASIYFNNKDKVKANAIFDELDSKDNPVVFLMKAIIKVWNNHFQESFSFINKYLEKSDLINFNINNEYLEKLIILLMAKKQYHFVAEIFEKGQRVNLKDQMKPIYYALMYNLKDKYPNEFLKMGEELIQPVDDVRRRIEEVATEYV